MLPAGSGDVAGQETVVQESSKGVWSLALPDIWTVTPAKEVIGNWGREKK